MNNEARKGRGGEEEEKRRRRRGVMPFADEIERRKGWGHLLDGLRRRDLERLWLLL